MSEEITSPVATLKMTSDMAWVHLEFPNGETLDIHPDWLWDIVAKGLNITPLPKDMSEEKSAPNVDERGTQRIDIVADHVEIHFPGGDWLAMSVEFLREALTEKLGSK